MRALERIWNDIRSGESIDLYATTTIAFIVVVLDLLDIAPPGLIAPLTLAVLGLLAVSNLVNRHRVQELTERIAESTRSFFLEEYPADIREHFESAKEVWLVGVTLRGTISSFSRLIEEKLRKGHSFKVLVVHPEGAAIEMAASRYYSPALTGRDPGRRGAQIKDSLVSFCGLQQIAPDKLEIRTIQNPLTFGAVCVNPRTTSAILYLAHFPYRTVADSLPKFVLRAADGRWYDFFETEIQNLWEGGIEWKCAGG
jgi:hypothetical protein